MMSAQLDVERLHSTKSEKLLAVVMLAFLLIGGIWAYQKTDDWVRDRIPLPSRTAQGDPAIARLDRARTELFRAQNRQRQRRSELELRREAYRTALDAGEPAPRLRARYLEANEAYEAAVRERERAQQAVAEAAPAANVAQRRLAAESDRRRDRQELVIFLVRTAASAVFLLVAFWLLARLRDRGSRYLPLAGAAVAFATIFAFVVAVDHATDYFNPLDSGLLFVSLLGGIATLAAFWVLQRYLARRLPARRVNRGECPFCGFRVRGTEHCEGCGRTVVAPCARCEAPRRVGTPRCGTCGAA